MKRLPEADGVVVVGLRFHRIWLQDVSVATLWLLPLLLKTTYVSIKITTSVGAAMKSSTENPQLYRPLDIDIQEG